MAIDGQTPCIVWSLAAMVVSMQDNLAPVFHKEGFQPPAVSLCWKNDRRWDCIFNLPEIDPAWQGLTHYGLVMPYGNIDLGQHWSR